MRERNVLLKTISLVIVSVFITTPLTSHANSDLIFTGAGAHSTWVVMNELKPALEKSSGHKMTLFGKQSMLGVGCNAGIKSTLQSSAEKEGFGMVCCSLSDAEITKKNLQIYPLALEPLMILSHETNPVENLTVKQVKDIFSGNIKNWQDIGGDDKAIVVVTRLHCKKRPGHWKRILSSPDKFTTQRINVQSADEMVKRVGDFEAAIGHAGTAWLRGDNSRTKIIRVNGYLPTSNNLKTGNYPFYRQLSAVTSKDASSELKTLMHSAQKEVLNNTTLSSEYQLFPNSTATH